MTIRAFCAVAIFLSSVSAQTPSRIINKSFYKFPPAVEKAKEQSLVAIEFVVPRLINGVMGTITMQSTGFVVSSDGSVITTMHSFGDVPSEWFNKMTYLRVHDGRGFFKAELQKFDWISDLAMIQINNWADNKKKFKKTAVMIARTGDKKNLEAFERLYAFRLAVLGDSIYDLPLTLGPYLRETNIPVGDEGINNGVLGLVNGATESGFSGSPLLGPDGRVYGVIQRTSLVHTYVVTADGLSDFIKSSMETLEKRIAEAQKKK